MDELGQVSHGTLVSIHQQSGLTGADHGISREILADSMLHGVGLPPTKTDIRRIELLSFIEANKDSLILDCHGRCNEHGWAKVLQCHRLMVERRNS